MITFVKYLDQYVIKYVSLVGIFILNIRFVLKILTIIIRNNYYKNIVKKLTRKNKMLKKLLFGFGINKIFGLTIEDYNYFSFIKQNLHVIIRMNKLN